ncbi:MAG: HAMP domain-containing histidine kinase [Bacteroidetes bacterium]|nr:HAMP domain-containing histidine kinase [Bacteroidota bacterium]
MRLSLKSKIWLTIASIVISFAVFLLLFFPAQQKKYFLSNYHKEIGNLTKTVALGVKIALTEQNFEGVETAMNFVKPDKRLKFIALLQTDTVWNDAHTSYTIEKTVMNTYPESYKFDPKVTSTEKLIVKSEPFETSIMGGEVVVGFNTTEIEKNMQDIRLIAMAVSIIVLLFGIGIGYWLSRTISKPVLALRDAAVKVGDGDLSQQVTKISNDEIGELGLAFNKMVNNLSDAEADIRKINKELTDTLDNLKHAQGQLVQSEKMASLGLLTAGIAHEINNPINFVSAGIDSLKENLTDLKHLLRHYMRLKPGQNNDEILQAIEEEKKKIGLIELIAEADELFASIKNGANRTTEIVKNLKSFARHDENELKKSNLEQGIDSTLVILRSQLKDRVEVIKEYGKIPSIICFPGQLNQVFINIINNAAQAIEGKGKIWIKTSVVDNMAEIRIKDSGAGMPEEVKKRIFDPFFTTKDVGVGTGLGLSITYGIIEKHEGKIEVESTLGVGTEFIIKLPYKD